MVESVGDFPFRQLRYDKYLIIEVLIHVEIQDLMDFMFAVNKETRAFVEHNFTAICNGFNNDGLITHQLSTNFKGYVQLENLYFQALKRNVRNRVFTIQLYINKDNFAIFDKLFRWIKEQQKFIKLRLKLEIYCDNIDHEDLSEFLNSNDIVELKISGLSQKLSLNDTLCQSLSCLRIDDDRYIDLSNFSSLQILGITVPKSCINKIVPYLASKFTADLFQRMQINLYAKKSFQQFDNGRFQVQDQQQNILPKHTQLKNANYPEDMNQIKTMIAPSNIFSVDEFSFITEPDIRDLEILSNYAKRVYIHYSFESECRSNDNITQANNSSATDYLMISSRIRFNDLIQLCNIFKNIKTLVIQRIFRLPRKKQTFIKINLPQLRSLSIDDSKALDYFTGLKSLTSIFIAEYFTKIDKFDGIFDPKNIHQLRFSGSPKNIEFLSMFKNLRYLEIQHIFDTIHFRYFLPKENSLISLKLKFNYFENKIISAAESLYQLCRCVHKLRYLRRIKIDGNSDISSQFYDFVEKLIQKMKRKPSQRTHPLTLIASSKVDQETANRLKQILKLETTVNQKLILKFNNEKGLLPKIDPEKNPIFHQFISMDASPPQ